MTDGLRYNHVSASLENPRGSQSEIDWDLKGQSWGYDMASLQLQASWYCLAGREKCFEQCDKYAGHVGAGLHLHSVGL